MLSVLCFANRESSHPVCKPHQAVSRLNAVINLEWLFLHLHSSSHAVISTVLVLLTAAAVLTGSDRHGYPALEYTGILHRIQATNISGISFHRF